MCLTDTIKANFVMMALIDVFAAFEEVFGNVFYLFLLMRPAKKKFLLSSGKFHNKLTIGFWLFGSVLELLQKPKPLRECHRKLPIVKSYFLISEGHGHSHPGIISMQLTFLFVLRCMVYGA